MSILYLICFIYLIKFWIQHRGHLICASKFMMQQIDMVYHKKIVLVLEVVPKIEFITRPKSFSFDNHIATGMDIM